MLRLPARGVGTHQSPRRAVEAPRKAPEGFPEGRRRPKNRQYIFKQRKCTQNVRLVRSFYPLVVGGRLRSFQCTHTQ